jgi:hypothetical protein
MKLGIMQPYSFPYLGHFALIGLIDEWVVFDVTQYVPKSWINRNRILDPKKEWQYISIPLVNSSRHIKISDARIDNLALVKEYVLGKLSHYRKKAPFYKEVVSIVERTFDCCKDEYLVSFNLSGLKTICEYLGVKFRYNVLSKMDLNIPANLGKGEWAPWVAKAFGAESYYNPIGGMALFDIADFQNEGIKLFYVAFKSFEYRVYGYRFQPDMSILDVLMWNSIESVKNAIQANTMVIDASEK